MAHGFPRNISSPPALKLTRLDSFRRRMIFMPILNRLILVFLLTLATGASCRCGLELLLELTGCNLLVCGDLDEPEADSSGSDEAPAEDCCPDDPDGPSGDDCLCCTGESELAMVGRDEVNPDVSYPVVFVVPPTDWQEAIRVPDMLPRWPGTQRGVGPPRTLLRQRTLLQV